jgi:tripartite-type tricarboxylate transporter receptor subunit TctC
MLAAVLLFGAITAAAGDDYPNRPVRIIVPGAAGGVSDVNVRRITEKLSQALKQPVVVENRPGASGNIGTEAAARSKPDGYTLVLLNASVICVNPVLFPKLSYQPMEDFLPITMGGRGNPILLVNPQLPVKTLSEFIAYAKSHPGQIAYGTPGLGTPQHLAGELLRKLAGVDLHHVPYKSQPEVLTDLIGGQIQATIEFPSVAAAYVKSGQLRALVIAGPNRKPVIPDVPTSVEAGLPEFMMTSWNGYFAPKGTPAPVVARLHNEIATLIKARDFADWLASLGSEAVGNTPEEFAAYIRQECPRWRKIAQDTGMRLD